MSVTGLQRLRKHQVGVQTSFGSNAAATRVLPYRGPIEINPNLEFPDVDTGSIDPALPPFAGAAEFTGTWEGKAAYNDLPYLWAGVLKGGVAPTGGGAAKTHTYQAASLTQDAFAYLTDQWGDDYTTDWIIGGGGIIDELTIGFDEDLGAWDVDASLIYARAEFGGPTGGLTVDTNPTWVYGADTEVFVDSAFGSIGTTKWSDAVHRAEVRIVANNDPKRFANGSNTRFQLTNYSRGAREIEIVIGTAKTAATVAERQTIDNAPPPERFLELRTTSPEFITGSTPYSQSIRTPARLMSVTDTEFGDNNTGYEFTYRAKYNSDLGYAIRVVTVTGQTATI